MSKPRNPSPKPKGSGPLPFYRLPTKLIPPEYQEPRASPFAPLGSPASSQADRDRLREIARLQALHEAEVLEKLRAEELPPERLRIRRARGTR